MEINGIKKVYLTSSMQTRYAQQLRVTSILYYGNATIEVLNYLAPQNGFRPIAAQLMDMSWSWPPLREELLRSMR